MFHTGVKEVESDEGSLGLGNEKKPSCMDMALPS